MNTPADRRECFFRAWAATSNPLESAFDKDAARGRFLAARRTTKSRPSLVREGVWSAAAAMAAAAAIALWARPAGPLSFTTPAGRGEVGAWLATDRLSELPLAFSERTQIVLRQDSRGRVETVGQKGAHFLLERGAVHAEVVHRTGTDWRFLAGPFEVRVTGTALNVVWDPAKEQFSVRVDNGAVVVHGPYLGGEAVVHAGERCIVDVPSKSMRFLSGTESDASEGRGSETSPLPAAVDPPVPPAAANPAGSETSRPAPLSPAHWTKLEDQGDYEGAYAAAQRAGAASLYRSASADALIELAKVGLFSGHRDMQREALLAVRRRFAGSHQSALAAYELGRASPAAEAAGWFETYLAEEPNAANAREALGRSLEAESLAHNEAAARDVARRYLSRYPDGPHAALARRTLANVE
jgi:hypothetical protein